MSTAEETESAAITTDRIRGLLRLKYRDEGWLYVEEVANATGGQFKSRADAVAFGCWPSRGYEIHGFEIKASRSDWRKDLDTPSKADGVAKFCDFWWIVAAQGVVISSELPPLWGLLVENKKGRLGLVKRPGRLEALPLDRGFVASLIRRHGQAVQLRADLQAEQRAEFKLKQKEREKETSPSGLGISELVARVKSFEERTGINLDAVSFNEEEADVLKRFIRCERMLSLRRWDIDGLKLNLKRVGQMLDEIIKYNRECEA